MRCAVPKVSVVIPIYNVERYLEESLDSLRAQTLGDFEAICVNDGSTDGSRALLQRYLDEDARFRVIDKENSGYGASMNRGLDAARGEYVAILEPDDLYEPDALERLVGAAQAADVPVAKGDFWLYWSTPEERRERFGFCEGIPAGVAVAPEDHRDAFYRKPSIWSAVYRRDFLEREGIRFTETPGASYQDASFNFKVWATAGRAVFLPEAVLSYRQDNEQSSVNSPGKLFCVCDEYAEMERFLDERPERRAALGGILGRMKLDTYLWNYDRLAPGLREEFLARASEELRADLEAGKMDLSLFEPWAEADLRALVESPERFAECRNRYEGKGKLGTFCRYWKLGGPTLIVKALRCKRERTR